MSDWLPIAVLPNIELGRYPESLQPISIEARHIALVHVWDDRVQKLMDGHAAFADFLSRFTDQFGVELSPTLLLVQAKAPRRVLSIDAIASFRDSIAITALTHARTQAATDARVVRGAVFTNSFWMHPWMITKDFEYLGTNTMAILGLHEVKAFHGQSSAETPHQTLTLHDFDEPLLYALLERWEHRFTRRQAIKTEDRALFRSLNMANQAAQMPAAMDATLYDVGRSLALWVSAFEILVHPRAGRSNVSAVYKLLTDAPWLSRDCRARRYLPYWPPPRRNNKPRQDRRAIACWLYGQIHRARCDFLHGEPVNPSSLLVTGSGRRLFSYPALLYRAALAAHLDLRWSKPLPSTNDPSALEAFHREEFDFTTPQRLVERALLMARTKHSDDN